MELQDLVKTSGWEEVEAMFSIEVERLKRDIPYKDKDNDFIAKRYIACREAERLIGQVLGRIKRATQEVQAKNISYK